MELINKNDQALLEEYEQFAKTSKYGNFMQSLKWPKVKDNWGWDAVISRGSDGKIRGVIFGRAGRIGKGGGQSGGA